MHNVVQNHLEAYLDGSLLRVERRELDAHLESCGACRQELAEMRQTREWMQALVAREMLAPAPGFYARVRARVEAEAGQVWPFWQLFPAFGRQLRFAALTLLLLVGAYLFTVQQTEQGISAAELMLLEAPVIRTETPALTADHHANRERVMMAIVAPMGRAEGD